MKRIVKTPNGIEEIEAEDNTVEKNAYEMEQATRPLTLSEVQALTIRRTINSLDIPDATASRMVDYYPTLTDFDDGALIQAKTVINWNGVLKRAAVDLWNTETNRPDSAPTLWADIAYRDGIRIIPETITAETAFMLNELGWWDGHIYKSGMDGNVYTPEQAPTVWELVR